MGILTFDSGRPLWASLAEYPRPLTVWGRPFDGAQALSQRLMGLLNYTRILLPGFELLQLNGLAPTAWGPAWEPRD